MSLFTSIPTEVFQANILPHVKWNDLLRLRRVCKKSNVIANEFIRHHPELAPELEIDQKDRNFEAFLKLDIPTTKVFLNNEDSGYAFFEKDTENMTKFLEKYGEIVRHLRLSQLSINISGKEWDFLEALVNLEAVGAGCIDGIGRKVGVENQWRWHHLQGLRTVCAANDPRYMLQKYPTVFLEKLKTLDIGQPDDFTFSNIMQITVYLLQKNYGLESVRLPFNPMIDLNSHIPANEAPASLVDPKMGMRIALHSVRKHIDHRKENFPNAGNLKVFDFDCYHNLREDLQREVELGGSSEFLSLCVTCAENKAQLKNVACLLFYFAEIVLQRFAANPNRHDAGKPILSLVNLHPSVFPVEMPNLEKIDIRSTSRSSVGTNWQRDRPEWPALKVLKINVDSQVDRCPTMFPQAFNNFGLPTRNLFQFFFQGVRRVELTELYIRFQEQVPAPRCDDIVASCPNLKKLSLVNWPGTNKSVLKVWDNLRGLEEISLEACQSLGNVVFVGENTANPVFFKLTRLRKLSLKGLDKMPKITDLLFSLVLRHLPLQQLSLSSDAPLKFITATGIASLLEGRFADTIENFPFQDWSLEGVPKKEFRKLERKFRSYDML